MYTWICPHCKRSIYSSYNFPQDKTIKCVYPDCEKEFSNQYYEEPEIKEGSNI